MFMSHVPTFFHTWSLGICLELKSKGGLFPPIEKKNHPCCRIDFKDAAQAKTDHS
jgi:hypothetical protein